ncbi:MAG: hypothetical protein K2Q23_17550 [Bryobacteraceae bacterium]|nr:hypothetical protein [Bryobacteraceae bacterium]
MPVVRATEVIRRLRGGAQSHLLRGEDGHCYVVKFRNNPQHRRVLINEWIAHAVFRHLRIATPEVAFVDVSPELLAANPDLRLSVGSAKIPVEPGWHFGSRYAEDPDRVAFYDFLPDRLLEQVSNLHDFRGALVADRWISNADARQAVFFRARVKQWAPSVAAHGAKLGFIAMMIDHGFAFAGPEWTLYDAPVFGLYGNPKVYAMVRGLESFEPWLAQVKYFPLAVLEMAMREIPPLWLENDGEALERLIEKLVRRQRQVPDLLAKCKEGRVNPFPLWP